MKRYSSRLQYLINNLYKVCAGTSFLWALLFSSCVREEMLEPVHEPEAPTRATLTVEKPGGLIQQADGTWKAENCRVPLVGSGCIVNDIFKQVDVISGGSEKIGNITDLDLKNHYTVPVAVEAKLLYTPITSVKDLHRVYDKGQKVGFVYKDNNEGGASLLDVKLLKGLTLTTYLKGVKQESSISDTGSSVLTLDLLSLNSNSNIENRVISFDATKPFDEVVLGVTGVDVNALTNISLSVKYAFVGENPEIRATSEPDFKFFWTGGSPVVGDNNIAGESNITDSDPTNSAPFTSEIGFASYAIVNLKKEMPVGSEVGFCYKVGKLIDLGVLGTDNPKLTTYSSNGKKLESSEPAKSLLGLSLIGGNGKKTFTNIEIKESCSQIEFQHPRKLLDLGGMSVFYAYVREGVKLDPANEFTFGNDTTYSNSYRLPKSEKGTVQYQVLYSPYGSKPVVSQLGGTQMLDGMTHDGAYRIQALYTSGTDGRQVSHIATIYRKSESRKEGNMYITARSHGAYAAEPIGWHGSLLSLFKGSNSLNNVVDNPLDNYAVAYNLLSLLEWSPVASFKLNTPVGGDGEVRTGFVVKSNTHLLDLTALSYFKIKLYSGSSLVYESASSGNSTVKLGLLGYDRSKVRLSALTDQSFDRMELWAKGAATLMESIRIYNIFYEDSACDATSEVGGGFELMTNIKDNLIIDYENTKLAGLLAVGQKATELGNMLDGSIRSGTLLQSTADIGSVKISLSFDKRPAGQPVGIILGEMPNLLNVNLVKIGNLKVFSGDNPEPVASTKKLEDLKILGADLISHGGRTYMEVTPDTEYDRVEFAFGGVELLSNSKVCGVYCRNVENDRGAGDGQLTVNDGTYRTCFGSPLKIGYKSTSLASGTKLSLYCEDIADNTVFHRVEAVLDDTEKAVVIPAGALPVGRYNVKIYSMEGVPLSGKSNIIAIIHPRLTQWKTSAATKDWNEWNNWSEGSPWKCTDVIIPSGAAIYPELSGTENFCRNIYFKSGAEVVGTSHLTYGGKAFVDMALQGGRNYMISAPLQETFTGDMFINPVGSDLPFTPFDSKNYPEMRHSPVVYQRFWSREATEKIVGKDGALTGVEVGEAQWSQEFNAVAAEYDYAQGFSLRAGDANDFRGYTFCFPKVHSGYNYWTPEGVMTGHRDTVARASASVGKLNPLNASVTLTNKGGKTFIMGNPLMCHLDVAKFLQANTGVSHILTYDGNTFNPTISIDGQLVSSQTQAGLKIAPMEAFFVVAVTAENSLSVNLNEGMFCQKSGSSSVRKTSLPVLRITAAAGGSVSSCVVVKSAGASDALRGGEDVFMMTDGAVSSPVSVFTLAPDSGRALSLQQMSGLRKIPLGFLRGNAGPVTLLFDAAGGEWDSWVLEDTLSGKQYPLRGIVELDGVENGSGRFILRLL